MRQLAPLFGISNSAADRIIDHLGPLLALQPRRRFARGAVLIADDTLVPIRDHTIAEQSKNYRYSTNHQVAIDADTRRVVVVGRTLPGNRNDCRGGAGIIIAKVHRSARRLHEVGPQSQRLASRDHGCAVVVEAGGCPAEGRIPKRSGLLGLQVCGQA
jgi:hypothetical protein